MNNWRIIGYTIHPSVSNTEITFKIFIHSFFTLDNYFNLQLSNFSHADWLIFIINKIIVIFASFQQFNFRVYVYLGVRTCEVFLCFVAIVRVRVYYADFFVSFVLRHWWVL